MTKQEAETIQHEFDILRGCTLTVREREVGGRVVERLYSFMDLGGYAIGPIRAVGASNDNEPMSYYLRAILGEVEGRRCLDRLPPHIVIQAVKSGGTLDLTAFPEPRIIAALQNSL